MQEKTKNEGLLSFITTVIKKSSELPDDISVLAGSVKVLSSKLLSVTSAIAAMAKTLQQHSIAISELYALHAALLQQMKVQGADSQFPPMNKTKSDKPN